MDLTSEEQKALFDNISKVTNCEVPHGRINISSAPSKYGEEEEIHEEGPIGVLDHRVVCKATLAFTPKYGLVYFILFYFNWVMSFV